MISIICVYNNERTLREISLKSLKNQTVEFELIKMDNTENKFKSAAEALNNEGKKAHSKYIMFLHQDVELGCKNWLEETEKILDNISDLGIAGVAGAKEGQIFGYIESAGALWGKPIHNPIEIQTLDECLVIIPKSVFERLQFDEATFDGWHCYAADYALSVKKIGLNAYVIPAFIYHRTISTNIMSLGKYLRRLYFKHKLTFKHIYIAGDGSEISTIKLFFMYMSPIYIKLIPRRIRLYISPLINKISRFVWWTPDLW
ncbi:MAG: glycosyltransferase family protein [Euryarchaeota archaeon]|nr:glycosyltransferase family protein [Euryarchaeota archaeon]MCG2736105.1 glycosyltransferase family protein [Candidatus Methanoperedenaceae archaeon]